MTVYPEGGGPAEQFDFTLFPVAMALQLAFAVAFVTLTARDGSHRSIWTCRGNFGVLRRFARLLATQPTPPRSAGESTVGYLAALRLASQTDHMVVKVCLRKMPVCGLKRFVTRPRLERGGACCRAGGCGEPHGWYLEEALNWWIERWLAAHLTISWRRFA